MIRNIGLAVKKPTEKSLDNENNNPFAGSLPIPVSYTHLTLPTTPYV